MNKKWGPGRLLLPLLLALGVGSVHAQVTNFSSDVNASIDRGLGWLDAVGAFNNPSSAGNSVKLRTSVTTRPSATTLPSCRKGGDVARPHLEEGTPPLPGADESDSARHA